ncbi:MAG TPA: hypothetical protein VFW40_00380, partial [Capsulimonadaceae bacterium]|nr:hypothetical protein [Capsulimonadaceae bacterium]
FLILTTHSLVNIYSPGQTSVPTDDKYIFWSRENNGVIGRVTRIGPLVIDTPAAHELRLRG